MAELNFLHFGQFGSVCLGLLPVGAQRSKLLRSSASALLLGNLLNSSYHTMDIP